MKKLFLISAGLLLANGISAAPQTCSSEMASKKVCVAGKTMRCVKIFTPDLMVFRYEIKGVNASGGTFDVTTPWYEKTAGYTPINCLESNSG